MSSKNADGLVSTCAQQKHSCPGLVRRAFPYRPRGARGSFRAVVADVLCPCRADRSAARRARRRLSEQAQGVHGRAGARVGHLHRSARQISAPRRLRVQPREPFEAAGTVQFDPEQCGAWYLRAKCTQAASGEAGRCRSSLTRRCRRSSACCNGLAGDVVRCERAQQCSGRSRMPRLARAAKHATLACCAEDHWLDSVACGHHAVSPAPVMGRARA